MSSAPPRYGPPTEPPPPLPPQTASYAPPSEPPPPMQATYAPPPLQPPDFYDPRFSGLGAMRALSDELLVEGILARYLDANDLTALSAVSRVLYLFSRDDQLWKHLCLSKWALGVPDGGNVVFKRTWRETYYRPGKIESDGSAGNGTGPPVCVITVPGFYSPYLISKWQRCHTDFSTFVDVPSRIKAPFYVPAIPPPEKMGNKSFWPYPHSQTRNPFHDEMTDVPKFLGRTATQEEFLNDVESKRIPALFGIELVKDWPAAALVRNGERLSEDPPSGTTVGSNPGTTHDWEITTLLSHYPKTTFKIGNEYGRPRRVLMDLRDYADYATRNNDDSPLYIFDPRFGEKCADMLKGYSVPPIFGQDLLECFANDAPRSGSGSGNSKKSTPPSFTGVPPSTPPFAPSTHRPDFRWLVLGPARSGASWHADPMSTSAWNTLIAGRKRWAFYPPHVPYPPGVMVDPTRPMGANAAAMGMARWYLEVYPRLPLEMRPLECIQEPGQTVFVPGGWWHAVLNLSPVNIAVTQNYLSEGNLESVLREVGRSQDGRLFYHLKRHILRHHPHLLPYFQSAESLYFPESNDPLILSDGARNRQELVSWFADPHRWEARVRQAIALSDLPADGEIEALGGGTNPVFLHVASGHVVKFFSHVAGGLPAWANEVAAYARIASSCTGLTDSNLAELVPQLVSLGLANPSADGTRQWLWPYIVTRRLQDAVSLADAMELPESTGADDDFGANGWRERRRESELDINDGKKYYLDKLQVAKWMGTSVRALHRLPALGKVDVPRFIEKHSTASDTQGLTNLVLSNLRTSFTRFLDDQWSQATARHERAALLPKNVIGAIAGYLHVQSGPETGDFSSGVGAHPPEDKVFKSAELASEEQSISSTVRVGLDWESLLRMDTWDGGSSGARFLHGDLNPNNIMGVWKVAHVEGSTTVLHFEPQWIIDLADSHQGPLCSEHSLEQKIPTLDPVFDFVPILVSCLGSRPDLAKAFLSSYRNAFSLTHDVDRTHLPVASRITRYWLGWEFEVVFGWGVRGFGRLSSDESSESTKVGREHMRRTFECSGWTGLEKFMWGGLFDEM
ncbi:Clavaminate synthase-like protein, partial [Gonapodya prolifera JEL478]